MSDSEQEDLRNLENPTVQAMARMIRALKGHLSIKINSAGQALVDAGDRPTSRSLQELVTYQERIQAQFERIEEAYTKIMEEDSHDSFEDYEKELDEEAKPTDEAVCRIRRFLLSRDTEVPAQSSFATPSGSGDSKVKPNKALEPYKLTREHNTVELRSWCDKFKAWYTSSRMASAPIQEQHAYFKMVIDVSLENKLKPKIQENTPIFGSDLQVSCIKLLEEEFLLRYPLLMRQMDFFEAKQAKGQTMSDWVSKLTALGEEADLSSMSAEDLYIMRYLMGTCDTKLREKFLEEPKPSLKRLDKIIHQHEMAESSVKAMTCSRTEARMVNQR